MRVPTTRRRFASVILASVAVLAVSTACGGDEDEPADPSKPVKLTLDVFGDQGFGYDELVKQFEKDNPGITVEQRGKGLGLGDYNTRLTQWIASGAGAGDVVALEEGTIVQFKAQANNFVNLLDEGAGELKDNFLPWKWEQALTGDGKLLGLGTDVGSAAMCYRTDLFAAAGLPTEPDKVSALWPTWQAYTETGKRFDAAPGNAKFIDAATNVFNTVLMQAAGNGTGYTFFDKSDKLVIGENPDVKTAWDATVAMINANLSAGLQSFSDPWTTGFKQAQFATIACPAWMTGVIEGNAGPAAAKKWNIAKVPGNGGNWGGSFLAVPKQSKNKDAAVKLAKFLTSPESQIAAFNAVGNLPSSGKALEDPAVLAKKNAYFNDAPTGEIFGAGAKDFKAVYLGAKNQPVRDAVENALRSIEQKKRTPDQAWQDAVKAAEAASR
ncbi:MAG TPA: extracellular solute-binding protein [Pilimelia sp.]|nr:extracellular solute-binding protein [Pilimelia sp.]